MCDQNLPKSIFDIFGIQFCIFRFWKFWVFSDFWKIWDFQNFVNFNIFRFLRKMVSKTTTKIYRKNILGWGFKANFFGALLHGQNCIFRFAYFWLFISYFSDFRYIFSLQRHTTTYDTDTRISYFFDI